MPTSKRSGSKPEPHRADPSRSAGDSADKPPAARQSIRRDLISDARAMRALAHPIRVALLEAIRRDGEITATQAAELLGESPGNMSWHLQTLAKYGFVEESGTGRGRSRPWRATRTTESFDTGASDPDAAAAGEALERTFIDRSQERMREWRLRRQQYPVEWRRAAFMSDTFIYVTAEELATIADEIVAIFRRYDGRDAKQKRPAGALPVQIFAHGHPLPPTAAGN